MRSSWGLFACSAWRRDWEEASLHLQFPHEGKRTGKHWSILSGVQWQDLREWPEEFRLSIRQRFFIQMVVEDWNGLLKEVVTVPGLTESQKNLNNALRQAVWLLGLSCVRLRVWLYDPRGSLPGCVAENSSSWEALSRAMPGEDALGSTWQSEVCSIPGLLSNHPVPKAPLQRFPASSEVSQKFHVEKTSGSGTPGTFLDHSLYKNISTVTDLSSWCYRRLLD